MCLDARDFDAVGQRYPFALEYPHDREKVEAHREDAEARRQTA